MLRVDHLTKRYGALTAVDDLSFVVQPGRVTGFLGPNGAGKTTTLRIALGLVKASAGSVTFDDQPYGRLRRPARQVGASLEAASFHPGRSALDHLRDLAPVLGAPDRRCAEVLELVGLSGAARRRVGQFSLGMRGRLSLATALLGDPETLLLDEPTNGLDPEGIAWLRDLLRRLAQAGRTVLISSHLLSEVQQSVDDIVIIAHGRLVLTGPLADLAQLDQPHTLVQPGDPTAFADLARQRSWALSPLPEGVEVTGPTAAEIGHVCCLAGLELHQLASRRPGLEATFLALTEGPAPAETAR
ncbi:MAG: ABC transporter ATP-binding protein [Propionibacteriaceae bacterium]|jgi:ABC-2 type transport system ATP-binding protein|nr:ABC transporter ATP-binding protein [Propionibacteriaceae bacterium]